MGCDIHMITQVRTKHGAWLRSSRFFECDECNGSGASDEGEEFAGTECNYCDGAGRTDGYGDRNYAVFAMLAGVRNSWGIEPVAQPRGLPVPSTHIDGDVATGELWMGDHNFSHLTLLEINEYAWPWEEMDPYPRSKSWDAFLVAINKHTAIHNIDPNHIRIVFGFDS